MKRKILITGVAGLLGSRLADWIIENQEDVSIVGIDDLSGGYIENINPNIEFIKLNLVEDSIEKYFEMHKFDYVFHFAAYAAEGLSPFIRNYNYKNNLSLDMTVDNNLENDLDVLKVQQGLKDKSQLNYNTKKYKYMQ